MVAADFEIDVGIAEDFELDLDGALAFVSGPDGGRPATTLARIVTVDDPSSSWDRSRVRCPAIIRYSLRTSTAVAGA